MNELLGVAGFRIVRRASENRFEAMGSVLQSLARRGFEPDIVIDGGANRGWFAQAAHRCFPQAIIHLIEPQAACQDELLSLTRASGDRMHVHRVAITAAGSGEVTIAGGELKGGTGAHIVEHDEGGGDSERVSATTLDELLAAEIEKAPRLLLKLDLQGHELPALSGASASLRTTEVIIAEVAFIAASGDGSPFGKLAGFLLERGFEIYDFASLSSRPRDGRLREADVVFVARHSRLIDGSWS